jgi:hypothetical protein
MQARKGGLALAVVVAALTAAAQVAQADEQSTSMDAVTGGAGAFSAKSEMVAGPALQVIFGERAVFHLDAKGEPVLDGVEKGPLAMAHPTGEVKETFDAPGPGKLAIALDGSPQKKASYLKIWNGLDHPVLYRAGVLAYEGGALKPITVRVCAAPSGGVSSQTWPAPIAAVVVANFTTAPSASSCK